jgi:hypothetical protein
MDIVFAVSTATVMDGLVPVQLIADRAYPADDPVVLRFPHLFVPLPKVYSSRGVVVEQATAAPGEKRTVTRAR